MVSQVKHLALTLQQLELLPWHEFNPWKQEWQEKEKKKRQASLSPLAEEGLHLSDSRSFYSVTCFSCQAIIDSYLIPGFLFWEIPLCAPQFTALIPPMWNGS